MISAPNTVIWMCDTVALENGRPNRPAMNNGDDIEEDRQKDEGGPRKAPMIRPTPPIDDHEQDLEATSPARSRPGSTEPR